MSLRNVRIAGFFPTRNPVHADWPGVRRCPGAASAPARGPISRLSIFVAALIALPALSIDVVMPGLAAMRLESGATLSESGLVVTVFLIGLALGQACLGPLSDRLGRRPILLGGLTTYVLAGIGCALAASSSALLACRMVQGVGAGAATVLALAIVRDLLEGEAARVVRSYAVAAFNVVPLTAPSLGVLMLAVSGWQAAHAAPAVLGAALLLWTFMRFEETCPVPKRDAVQAAGIRARFLDRRFVSCVALNAASYAAVVAYIAGSSLALMDGLGLSAGAYALALAGTSVTSMLGAWANGRLARRCIRGSTLLCIGVLLAGASTLLLAALPVGFDVLSGSLVTLAVTSRALIGPNAQQAALDPIPNTAGAAATLLSLAQVVAGAAASAAVVPLYRGFGPQGVAYAMAGFSTVSLAAWAMLHRSNAL